MCAVRAPGYTHDDIIVQEESSTHTQPTMPRSLCHARTKRPPGSLIGCCSQRQSDVAGSWQPARPWRRFLSQPAHIPTRSCSTNACIYIWPCTWAASCHTPTCLHSVSRWTPKLATAYLSHRVCVPLAAFVNDTEGPGGQPRGGPGDDLPDGRAQRRQRVSGWGVVVLLMSWWGRGGDCAPDVMVWS